MSALHFVLRHPLARVQVQSGLGDLIPLNYANLPSAWDLFGGRLILASPQPVYYSNITVRACCRAERELGLIGCLRSALTPCFTSPGPWASVSSR
jgi:hypothetical protein